MIRLKDLLYETFDDAAFHGHGMTPQQMKTGTCSTTWSSPDQDTGCPQFEFSGKISKEDLNKATKYLNSEDIGTIVGYSAGGALLLQAITSGAKKPGTVNLVAPAWKRKWVSGAIDPSKAGGSGFIIHGTDDSLVPLAHSVDLAQKSGMPLYVVKGANHVNILKHKLSPSGKQVKDFAKALELLPDWGMGEGTSEDIKKQQEFFNTL